MSRRFPVVLALAGAFAILAHAAPAAAAAAEPLHVAAGRLQAGGVDLVDGWQFHPGGAETAPPGDDAGWVEFADTSMTSDASVAPEPAIGWFRLRLSVDPALAHSPVALVTSLGGAGEIFFDGASIQAFGTVAPDWRSEEPYDPQGLPVALVFPDADEHVLALRCSFAAARYVGRGYYGAVAVRQQGAGFRARLEPLAASTADYARRRAVGIGVAAGGLGLAAALFLLHAILFLFLRDEANKIGAALAGAGVLYFALQIARFAHLGVAATAVVWALGLGLTGSFALLYAHFARVALSKAANAGDAASPVVSTFLPTAAGIWLALAVATVPLPELFRAYRLFWPLVFAACVAASAVAAVRLVAARNFGARALAVAPASWVLVLLALLVGAFVPLSDTALTLAGVAALAATLLAPSAYTLARRGRWAANLLKAHTTLKEQAQSAFEVPGPERQDAD